MGFPHQMEEAYSYYLSKNPSFSTDRYARNKVVKLISEGKLQSCQGISLSAKIETYKNKVNVLKKKIRKKCFTKEILSVDEQIC